MTTKTATPAQIDLATRLGQQYAAEALAAGMPAAQLAGVVFGRAERDFIDGEMHEACCRAQLPSIAAEVWGIAQAAARAAAAI